MLTLVLVFAISVLVFPRFVALVRTRCCRRDVGVRLLDAGGTVLRVKVLAFGRENEGIPLS